MKRVKETLIGDVNLLEFLSWKHEQDDQPHPLQELVEDIIASLTPDLQDVFYMRYGQHMTIRAIAAAQGYDGHQIIQYKLDKIAQKVREAVEENTNNRSGEDDSHVQS